MKVIEVSGSPRRIGERTGEATRELVRRHLELYPPDLAKVTPRLATYADTLARHLPDVLEELRGLARGAGLAEELVLALNFAAFPDELRVDDGCSNVAVAAGPDGPLWGKNNDGGEPSRRRPTIVRIVRPDHGLPVAHVHFAGWVGVGDGMNAEGLCTGSSSVGSKFQMSDRFVNIREWGHHQLHHCRTTGEYLAAMTELPLRGKGFAMVLADRHGSICAVEAPCPLLQVRRPEDPRFVICTNRYFLPPLADADRRPPGHKEEATARFEMIHRSLAAREAIGLDALHDALTQHDSPVSSCKHGDAVGHWTEYGLRAECAHGRLHIYDGPPCEGRCQVVVL